MALSRRHWRFIVRDAYGYAIQNARVYVYQPGTTTAFLGSAYDAATGGAAVSNPLTTNAQGEVQAWFDTEQTVDVFVDDNADTAYRAKEGAGVPISFTAFTEADKVSLQPEDEADDDETSSALTAAIAALYTTAAPLTLATVADDGAETTLAKSDHRHPYGTWSAYKNAKQTKTTAAEEVIGTATIPADTVAVGTQFRVSAKFFQTNSTTAITFTFRLRWGGLAGVLLDSIVLVGTTTTHTDLPCSIDAIVTVRAIGAAGTFITTMSVLESITLTTATTAPRVGLSTQQAEATVDTTASKDLVLTAELSATTGSPNVEIDTFAVERIA